MDPLHAEFRQSINYAWKNLAGQQAFNNIKIDHDLKAVLPEEFSIENQIQKPLSCGESANRVCELLTGRTMGDVMTSPDAVDLADDDRLKETLEAMKADPGYFLVRINISGGGAGHAYVFLSILRKAAGDPLEGYIYQTNVAVHVSSAFGLQQWVLDEKSGRLVNLAAHLDELREKLCGIGPSEGPRHIPIDVYQNNYMLSNKYLRADEAFDLYQAVRDDKRAKVKFLWSRVELEVFRRNAKVIRDAAMFGKIRG